MKVASKTWKTPPITVTKDADYKSGDSPTLSACSQGFGRPVGHGLTGAAQHADSPELNPLVQSRIPSAKLKPLAVVETESPVSLCFSSASMHPVCVANACFAQCIASCLVIWQL